MSVPEPLSEVPVDAPFTTALGQALDDEPERLTSALDQLDGALGGADRASRRRARMLIRELVSQALGTSSRSVELPLELDVIVRSGAVRVEASGRAVHFMTAANGGPPMGRRGALAAWGAFIVEGLADRWGTEGAEFAWFEIDKAPV